VTERLVLVLLMLSAGCGEKEQSPSLTCGTTALEVRGDLAGEPVDEQAEVAGQNLDNLCAAGCYLDVYFVGGGRLHLEWAAPLTLEEEGAGSGYLNLFSRGGPNVGNSASDGFPSRVTLGQNEVGFVLRQLREAPYSTGNPVAGELTGCATFE
jgi:hypothetical protein